MSSSDSDDDCNYGNTQCLPIHPFDIKSVDLTKCPTTAQEHMQYVIAERKLMKKILRVEPVDEPMLYLSEQDNTAQDAANQNTTTSNETGEEKMEVTVEWYHKEISEFSVARDTVDMFRKIDSSSSSRLPFINLDDDNPWTGENGRLKKNVSLKDVAVLKDSGLIIFLEHMEKWLLRDPIKMTDFGEMLYKVLACLSIPVDKTTSELLKRIMNNCKDIQSKLNPNDEQFEDEVAAHNQITCILVKYFI